MNNLKRVIVVFHDNDLYSGGTLSHLSNVNYMIDNKIEIVAIIPQKDGELKDYLENKGVKVYQRKYGGNVYSAKKYGVKKVIAMTKCLCKSIVSFFSAFCLSLCLHKTKYDIVYTNTSTINYGYWLSRFLHVKHIWHFREFCYEDQDSLRMFEKSFIKKARSANEIITISKVLDKYYRQKYGLKNTLMMYDDLSKDYLLNSKERKLHSTINFLMTGTFSEGKGQFDVVKAFEKLNCEQAHLYLAGRINVYGEKIQAYVQEKNIKNVHFCGFVKDMKSLRETMDYSIVNSRSEAFGRIIIEDMLAGIIVLGSDRGSVPELISDGENGYIFQYNNVESLSSLMEKCIDNNNDVIKKKSLEFAKQFVNDNTAHKILEIIQNN